ncbi:MAG: PilZ domain-containing protein [Planctomycetota bacterium]|nr:PilZ domain-containing protein [Planctomycetota bacterium]
MPIESRRKSKRHELETARQIPVRLRRVGAECEPAERVEAAGVVDISRNGFKLEAECPLAFREKLLVELPSPIGGEGIQLHAEVRWVQPDNASATWSAGCWIPETFPTDYLDEISQQGLLDRRVQTRERTDQPATGRWEHGGQEMPVSIRDVSSKGVSLLVSEEIEIGKRIRLRVGKVSELVTARAVWQESVPGGFLVGCEVIEGSPYSILEDVVLEARRNLERASGHYQTLILCGLVLILVVFLRDLIF